MKTQFDPKQVKDGDFIRWINPQTRVCIRQGRVKLIRHGEITCFVVWMDGSSVEVSYSEIDSLNKLLLNRGLEKV